MNRSQALLGGLHHLSRTGFATLAGQSHIPGCTHADEAVGWLALGCSAAQSHQHQCQNPLCSDGGINTLPTSSWGLWSHTFPSVFSPPATHPSYFYVSMMIKFWNFKQVREAVERQSWLSETPTAVSFHRPRNRLDSRPGTWGTCPHRVQSPQAKCSSPGSWRGGHVAGARKPRALQRKDRK